METRSEPYERKAVRGMDEDKRISQGAEPGEASRDALPEAAGGERAAAVPGVEALEAPQREAGPGPLEQSPQVPGGGAGPEQEREELTGEVEEAPPGPQDYMSDWGRRANALSEKAWRICQILMGAVMGLACAACLLFFRSDGFLPVNFIVAFLLAKFGPDFVEKWFERKAPTSRGALLIALAAALAAYIVYGLLTHRFG